MRSPQRPHTARDHRVGFALSLTPAILWGLLPIAVAGLGSVIDGVTLTWYRFCFALIAQTLLLVLTGRAGGLLSHRGHSLLLILVAAVGLVTNFAAFASSLKYLPASTAQTLSQVQPVLLMTGGALFFRERLARVQLAGALVLCAGLVIFFADRLEVKGVAGTALVAGFLLVGLAAIAWPAAALAQKALAPTVPSTHTLWYVYLVGAVGLAPLASPHELISIRGTDAALFLFCCLNTLIAYGSFALAVRRWQAARVSAVVTLGPVVTYLTEALVNRHVPGVLLAQQRSVLRVLGAGLVVSGAMLTALAHQRVAAGPPAPLRGSDRHPASS